MNEARASRSQAPLGNARLRTSASPALLIAALLLCGCAGWREKLAPTQPNLAAERTARRDAAVKSFEEHRDAIQLQAAIDRFHQGDFAGCESRLVTLVQRRPDFVAARLRLAEIVWSRGDAAAAEEHYLAVLSVQPDHAEAHHGLGMLLEAEGRMGEAESHLARAAALDPVLAAEGRPEVLPPMDAENADWRQGHE